MSVKVSSLEDAIASLQRMNARAARVEAQLDLRDDLRNTVRQANAAIERDRSALAADGNSRTRIREVRSELAELRRTAETDLAAAAGDLRAAEIVKRNNNR